MLSRFFPPTSSQENNSILPITEPRLLPEMADCLISLEKAFSKYKNKKRYSTPYIAKTTLNITVLLGMVVALSVIWSCFHEYEANYDQIKEKRNRLYEAYSNSFHYKKIPDSDVTCQKEEKFLSPCWRKNMYNQPFCQSLYEQFCPEINKISKTMLAIDRIAIFFLLGGIFGTAGMLVGFFLIVGCMLQQRSSYHQQLNTIKAQTASLQDCINEGLLTVEEVNKYQRLAQRLNLQTNKSMMELIADLKAKNSEIILKTNKRYAFLSCGLDSNKETTIYNFFKNSQGSEKEMVKQIFSFAGLDPMHKV